MFVWAWDARPYPVLSRKFGNLERRGQLCAWALAEWPGYVPGRFAGVIAEICAEAGMSRMWMYMREVYGLVRGYVLDGGEDARAALQPLLVGVWGRCN